jgi:hypothetical protein
MLQMRKRNSQVHGGLPELRSQVLQTVQRGEKVSNIFLVCGSIIVKNSRLRSPFIDTTDDFLRSHIRREAFIDGFIR